MTLLGSMSLAVARALGSGEISLTSFLPSTGSIAAALPGLTAGQILETLDQVPGRQLEIERLWSYYENEQYSEVSIAARDTERGEKGIDQSNAQLSALYLFIQSFFNPVAQVVDMDVDCIFGDDGVSFDIKDDSAENDGRQEMLDEILDRSFFETELVKMLRGAMVTGDAYLCVDVGPNDGESSVRLYSYPADVARVIYNPHNRNEIIMGVVSYDYDELVEDDEGEAVSEVHNRTDIFLATTIYTLRDGDLWDFNGIPSTRVNRMGMVPIVAMKNMDVDKDHGIPTFNHVLATMDAVNEVFSFLVNIVKINADPPVIAEGVDPAEGLTKGSSENPLDSTVFYVTNPEGKSGQSVYLLEWKGNLPDVLGLLKQVKDDVIDSLPEMHVSKMQQQGAYSGQALNAMMFAFVRKIGRYRKYYRAKVSQALQMALAAQAMLDGERADFDWRDPKYKVVIKLPAVLPVDEDALLNRVMSRLKAGLIGAEQALEELGYPTDEIPDILKGAAKWADQQMQQQIKLAKATRPVTAGGAFGKPAGGSAQAKGGAGSTQAKKATNNQPINKQLNSGK